MAVTMTTKVPSGVCARVCVCGVGFGGGGTGNLTEKTFSSPKVCNHL